MSAVNPYESDVTLIAACENLCISGIALYVSLFLVFQCVCSIVCDCVRGRFKGLVFECVLNNL